MSSKITIIIDEAGTLPDPKDKVVIMAAVGSDAPNTLSKISVKVRQKIKHQKKEKQISEIKFYTSGERTKIFYLKEILKNDIAIFVLIIDKDKQKIKDNPENFALLAFLLIKECFLLYKEQDIKEIIFDRHFHKEKDLSDFNNILIRLLEKKFNISHLDSRSNPEVNSADMIAGSLLWKYTGKDDKFYKIIENRIISEKILHWREAKKMFFQKNKKPHEPA